MQILHISAECYPAAKAGGLGDVVGSLPKYLNQSGVKTGVIIPKYHLKWILSHEFEEVFRGMVRLGSVYIPFTIEYYTANDLGYDFYVCNIPGLFDRPGIYADSYSGYGYNDELERYLTFQQSVLHWVMAMKDKPLVLHCHDHHTGLIPFMVKYCPEYRSLAGIPTVFTIHNGNYHGSFSWKNVSLLPWFDSDAAGYLEWGGYINPLATGIKCCWRLTTVSPSYMGELRESSMGLEWLFSHEQGKSIGILNGIDAQVWNPSSDPLIQYQLKDSIREFKAANKKVVSDHFKINPDLPLITFIGRLVTEKGADLIPDLVSRFLYSGLKASFMVLGTGDPHLKEAFLRMKHHFVGFFDTALEYNESLSHQLYAGSDFLLMPSRIEPCGLNQMYSLRYGTIPIVRSVGGLKDTVRDIGEENGMGIRFNNFSLDDAFVALYRAVDLYQNQESMDILRARIMAIDHSWEKSAQDYIRVYNSIIFT